MLWDVDAGMFAQKAVVHSKPVFGVDLSRDGTKLVSCSADSRIYMCALEGGKLKELLTQLHGHKDEVWSVKFSPDGSKVASTSKDETVKIWDVQSGLMIQSFDANEGAIASVAWSADGESVAFGSGTNGKSVHVRNVVGALDIISLTGHSSSVWSVVWSSTDPHLLASGGADNNIIVWTLGSSNKEVRPVRLLGHYGNVNSVSLSPGDKFLVSGSDDASVNVWDVAAAKLLRTLKGNRGPVHSVAWSRQGHHIISGGEDKLICVWRVNKEVHDILKNKEVHDILKNKEVHDILKNKEVHDIYLLTRHIFIDTPQLGT